MANMLGSTRFDESFRGKPAVVLGTGPSLSGQIGLITKARKENKIRIFGVNRTWKDLPVDVLICCDPSFHDHYGKVTGPFTQWHWSEDICNRHGYNYIEGRWFDGLSTDPSWISLNHCSSAQALNLAVHYGCDPILLVGHDFNDTGKRHYFDNLSETRGEYPANLRKYSKFIKNNGTDDLLAVYKRIADQKGLPKIINCTPGSALPWFPMGDFKDYTA